METSNIKLYPESNERIADLLLLCEDNAMCIYAGTYIKSLEEQLKRYKGLEERGKLQKTPYSAKEIEDAIVCKCDGCKHNNANVECMHCMRAYSDCYEAN